MISRIKYIIVTVIAISIFAIPQTAETVLTDTVSFDSQEVEDKVQTGCRIMRSTILIPNKNIDI